MIVNYNDLSERPHPNFPVEPLVLMYVPPQPCHHCKEHYLDTKPLALDPPLWLIFIRTKVIAPCILVHVEPFFINMYYVAHRVEETTVQVNMCLAKIDARCHVSLRKERLDSARMNLSLPFLEVTMNRRLRHTNLASQRP